MSGDRKPVSIGDSASLGLLGALLAGAEAQPPAAMAQYTGIDPNSSESLLMVVVEASCPYGVPVPNDPNHKLVGMHDPTTHEGAAGLYCWLYRREYAVAQAVRGDLIDPLDLRDLLYRSKGIEPPPRGKAPGKRVVTMTAKHAAKLARRAEAAAKAGLINREEGT